MDHKNPSEFGPHHNKAVVTLPDVTAVDTCVQMVQVEGKPVVRSAVSSYKTFLRNHPGHAVRWERNGRVTSMSTECSATKQQCTQNPVTCSNKGTGYTSGNKTIGSSNFVTKKLKPILKKMYTSPDLNPSAGDERDGCLNNMWNTCNNRIRKPGNIILDCDTKYFSLSYGLMLKHLS